MPFMPRRSARTGAASTSTLALFLAGVALLIASGCSVDSVSGTGTPGVATADVVEVPLPSIGFGSDTELGSSAQSVDLTSVERAVMVGDSITVGSTPFLVEYFAAAGLPIEISAQEGKRINVSSATNPSGTRVAAELAAAAASDGSSQDELWVVALGTNDIGQYADQAGVEAEIRELLAVVPADAPLVWINTWFRDRPEITVEVNAAIETVMTERGNAAIGDWASVASTEGVLRTDGVHPNDIGAKVFADLVVATTSGFLQR